MNDAGGARIEALDLERRAWGAFGEKATVQGFVVLVRGMLQLLTESLSDAEITNRQEVLRITEGIVQLEAQVAGGGSKSPIPRAPTLSWVKFAGTSTKARAPADPRA